MWRSILLIGLVPLLIMCESEGGGGTEPGPTGPQIVDSFTCREVDGQGRPLGIGETFESDYDDRVYVWAYWEGVENTHLAEVVWYDPNGSRELEDSQEFSSNTGEQLVWFYIDPLSMEAGRWEVELWLDNIFYRSHFFYIIPS